MSHGHIEKPTDITVPATSLWAKLPLIGGVAGVIGLGATAGLGLVGSNKERAFFSYIWAYELVLSLALGALSFVIIHHLVRAGWSTVVRRIAETAAMTLPVFALLFIPVFFGFHDLFPWSHAEHLDEILKKKTWWLSSGFFWGRAVFYFATWSFFAWFFHSRSVKQDALGEHQKAERDALSRSMWRMAPAGIAVVALTLSGQAIDNLMSLQPHWYSTIFGVYYFAGAMIGMYAFVTLVIMGLQKAGVLNAVTTEHFHDLGKFLFGHTVFWAYIAFSQFFLIWYANIPEETEYFIHRTHGGWHVLTYAMPFIHFFIPFFFLISRHVKRSRVGLAIGAIYLLVVHALDLYHVVLPNVGAHAVPKLEAHFAPHLLDLTSLLGVGGIFMAVFGFLLKRHKIICIGDPRLEESLKHENY